MHLYKSSMESPKEPPLHHHPAPLDQLGLEPLNLHRPKKPPHMIMISDLLSPTSSSLLSTGDYIGMESSVDVLRDSDDISQVVVLASGGGSGEGRDGNVSKRVRCRREQKWGMKSNKEFPPPIPMLARTENLPSHMPWVLKRNYTSDDRLVLTEEKVRHHEYFRAHRSNGRLTLQLVQLDHDVVSPFASEGSENEKKGNETTNDDADENECELDLEESFDDHGSKADGEYDDHDDEDDGDNYGDDDVVESRAGIGGSTSSSSSSPAGKCFNFNSVGTGSPCIFGVPVPAIRQVHS